MTQQHTHKILNPTACCVLLFVKREVHRCDHLQFLVHLFSSTLIGSFNFNFSSQYVLLGLTSYNTSNIVYYTAILCHKLVFLVLVRLIAIKIFNRTAALEMKLFQNYFSLRRRPAEIILFQHMETCLKLFQKLIAAHE